jgi:hypothetical protein
MKIGGALQSFTTNACISPTHFSDFLKRVSDASEILSSKSGLIEHLPFLFSVLGNALLVIVAAIRYIVIENA